MNRSRLTRLQSTTRPGLLRPVNAARRPPPAYPPPPAARHPPARLRNALPPLKQQQKRAFCSVTLAGPRCQARRAVASCWWEGRRSAGAHLPPSLPSLPAGAALEHPACLVYRLLSISRAAPPPPSQRLPGECPSLPFPSLDRVQGASHREPAHSSRKPRPLPPARWPCATCGCCFQSFRGGNKKACVFPRSRLGFPQNSRVASRRGGCRRL